MAQKMESTAEKYTPTEKDVNNLANYLFRIEIDIILLEDLGRNPSFKKLPIYKKLKDVRERIGAYSTKLVEYSKDIESLVGAKSLLKEAGEFLGGDAYKVASEIKEYGERRFRSKNWKDEDTETLEKAKELPTYIEKAKEIVKKLYEQHSIEPELKEKIEKMKKAIPEKKMLAIVVVISLGFGLYRILGDAEMSRSVGLPTASYVLPTAGFVTAAGFEMFYLVAVAIVLAVYFLGKIAKKW